MNYYLIDCSKKDINFNFDNVIIGRKINSKFYIYYQKEEYKNIEDIYIKMPKIRNIYKLGTSKYNLENIPIYPNYDLTNNFISFIKDFEKNLYDCFVIKLPNIELNSIINKKNNINNIKIYIDENIDTNIKINEIKINSELELIIKINYIWYNENNNNIGLNISLFQINCNMSLININISPKIINIPINNNIINNINNNINENSKNEIINPLPIRPSLIPSVSDLNLAIRKLKSTPKTD